MRENSESRDRVGHTFLSHCYPFLLPVHIENPFYEEQRFMKDYNENISLSNASFDSKDKGVKHNLVPKMLVFESCYALIKHVVGNSF